MYFSIFYRLIVVEFLIAFDFSHISSSREYNLM